MKNLRITGDGLDAIPALIAVLIWIIASFFIAIIFIVVAFIMRKMKVGGWYITLFLGSGIFVIYILFHVMMRS